MKKWLEFAPVLWALRVGARLLAPKQYVGAVGAVFNDSGQVLLVEHVFRTDFPWGLPGGWVKPRENPSDTLRREIMEELKLKIAVKGVLASEQIGLVPNSSHPYHLGLAFYCRLVDGEPAPTAEILSYEWCDPADIRHLLAPFQMKAIFLAKEALEKDTSLAQLHETGEMLRQSENQA